MKDNKIFLFSAITILTDDLVHFEDTFNSLVRQPYPHWELIIICSLDNKEALSEFDKKFFSEKKLNIRIIYFNDFKNYAAAMNVGFRAASGDYILFIDQFDEISDHYFTYVVENYSVDNPQLFYSEVVINYKMTLFNRPLLTGVKSHPSNNEFLSLRNISNRPTIISLSFLFPKNITAKIGYLKETECDFPLWDFIIKASYSSVFHKMSFAVYHMTVKKSYNHPRLLSWDENKVTNFKYLTSREILANNEKFFLNQGGYILSETGAVCSDEPERCNSITRMKYNKIPYTLTIKAYKLIKYILMRMRLFKVFL